jgi:hypothetical protein
MRLRAPKPESVGLDAIHRELPRAERDLAAVSARVAAHGEREAELVERGVDSYLDGQDEALVQRERAEFDAAKVNDLRERERLQAVVARLRERALELLDADFDERKAEVLASARELRVQHGAALANAARLEGLIAQAAEDSFELERERLDARSAFNGRVRNWQQEDSALVRKLVDQRLKGQAGQDPVPPRLQKRVDAALASARSPSVREAERANAIEAARRAGHFVLPASGSINPVEPLR